MGLFGYDKKDFAKNSEYFKSRINDLMMRSGNQFGVGKVLNAALLKLDLNPIPDGFDKKKLAAIDERISELLKLMMTDIQRKSPATLSSHAEMLLSAVEDVRQYGAEIYTPDELHAQEEMAQCMGSIHDALNKKSKIEEQKAELVERGAQLAKSGQKSELEKLQIQFKRLAIEEETQSKTVAMFAKRYNSFVQVVNAREVGKQAKVLQARHLVSEKDFAREMEETNAILAQESAKDDAIDDIFQESEKGFGESYGGAASDGGFMALVNDAANKELQDSLSGAKASSAAEDDEFMRMINNKL